LRVFSSIIKNKIKKQLKKKSLQSAPWKCSMLDKLKKSQTNLMRLREINHKQRGYKNKQELNHREHFQLEATATGSNSN
jgi:hypothetical protein